MKVPRRNEKVSWERGSTAVELAQGYRIYYDCKSIISEKKLNLLLYEAITIKNTDIHMKFKVFLGLIGTYYLW